MMGTGGGQSDGGLAELATLLGDDNRFSKKIKELSLHAAESQRMMEIAKEENRGAQEAREVTAGMLKQAQARLAEAHDEREKTERNLALIAAREIEVTKREEQVAQAKHDIELTRLAASREVMDQYSERDKIRAAMAQEIKFHTEALGDAKLKAQAEHRSIVEEADRIHLSAMNKHSEAERALGEANTLRDQYSARLDKLVALASGN